MGSITTRTLLSGPAPPLSFRQLTINLVLSLPCTTDMKESKQRSLKMALEVGRHVSFRTIQLWLTFAGNDFIDMSNIVGAGGNMTVQQVGDNHTRKGDPLFMQHLNTAWHKAGAGEKNALKSWVHTNAKGDVVRIDAIKNHPELEKFVRSFADGKTYIGIGAWGGSPGVDSDNKQVCHPEKPKPRSMS
jgi:hypothetical protein